MLCQKQLVVRVEPKVLQGKIEYLGMNIGSVVKACVLTYILAQSEQ